MSTGHVVVEIRRKLRVCYALTLPQIVHVLNIHITRRNLTLYGLFITPLSKFHAGAVAMRVFELTEAELLGCSR